MVYLVMFIITYPAWCCLLLLVVSDLREEEKKNKGELNVERFILRVKKKARKEELGARAMGL